MRILTRPLVSWTCIIFTYVLSDGISFSVFYASCCPQNSSAWLCPMGQNRLKNLFRRCNLKCPLIHACKYLGMHCVTYLKHSWRHVHAINSAHKWSVIAHSCLWIICPPFLIYFSFSLVGPRQYKGSEILKERKRY